MREHLIATDSCRAYLPGLGGQEHFEKISPGPETPHAYFKSLLATSYLSVSLLGQKRAPDWV